MKLFWTCILVLIILLAIYIVIHRLYLRRATMIMNRQNEQVLDAAVNTSIQEILPGMPKCDSQLVADVWGKGVMAFEYSLDTKQQAYNDDKINRDILNQALSDYAKQHDLQSADSSLPPIIVTDWWVYQGILHIDVAYLSNEATAEYVKDLKTLDANS